MVLQSELDCNKEFWGVSWIAIRGLAPRTRMQYGVLRSGVECNMGCCRIDYNAIRGVADSSTFQYVVLRSGVAREYSVTSNGILGVVE